MRMLLTMVLAFAAGSANAAAPDTTGAPGPGWVDELAIAAARELYDQDRLDEAEIQLRALAKRRPLSAEGLALAGDILRQRGDWAEAEAAFRTAIAALPGRADLHLKLGDALYRQKKRDAADAEFAKYVELRGFQP